MTRNSDRARKPNPKYNSPDEKVKTKRGRKRVAAPPVPAEGLHLSKSLPTMKIKSSKILIADEDSDSSSQSESEKSVSEKVLTKGSNGKHKQLTRVSSGDESSPEKLELSTKTSHHRAPSSGHQQQKARVPSDDTSPKAGTSTQQQHRTPVAQRGEVMYILNIIL